MADAHSSRGDPARSIALLWRDPAAVPRRGPARAWDLDAVVAAAIGLADAGGLAAVTIRAVARAVGAAPMSLYTYVPGKAELLDLMLDAAYAAMPRADTVRAGVAGAGARGRRGEPGPVRRPSVGRAGEHRAAAARARLDRQVRARAGRVRRARPRRRRPRRLPGLRRRVRAGRGARRPGRGRPGGARTTRSGGPRRVPCWRGCSTPPPTRWRAGSAAAAGAAHGSAADPDHAYRFGLDRVLDGLAAFVVERVPAAARRTGLDALDTEIRRGAAARRPLAPRDPTADPEEPMTTPHPTTAPREIVLHRHYATPAEDVWAAFTESDRLARWIGHYTGARPGGRHRRVHRDRRARRGRRGSRAGHGDHPRVRATPPARRRHPRAAATARGRGGSPSTSPPTATAPP